MRLLASYFARFYNTGIAIRLRKARKQGQLMDKFEEVGRKLDEELGRLRRFVEEDLAPKTEEHTAQFLREVSEKLTNAASWLDERRAAREAKSKETSA
jgi:hypothetical protein